MKYVRWWVCLLMLAASPVAADVYQVTTCELVDGKKVEGNGSAVCVATAQGRSLLLTAKHVVESGPQNTWIGVRGQWVLAENVQLHPTADLAAFEVAATLRPTPLGDDLTAGQEVIVDGLGPSLAKQDDSRTFTGTVEQVRDDDLALLIGAGGLHVMPGDSGGAVIAHAGTNPVCVGIVSWHEGGTPARSRRYYSRQAVRVRSGFTNVRTIQRFVQTQYGRCYNGACPIQIRPHVQQPMIGIGIPVGPPRVVGIAEPVPQTYVPQPMPQQPIGEPQTQYIQGERGPAGPQGPKGDRGPVGLQGPAGNDGQSVKQEQVEAIVNAWLDSNRDALRGEPGPPGNDGASADPDELTEIATRLKELETRPFRIVISSEGKVVDDETYAPGEPVVLDLQRLRKRSDAN